MAHKPLPWPTRLPATWVRHLVRLVFVVCGLAAGLSACGAAPVVPAAAASAASAVQAPTAYSVLVVNHGRHAGLLLRAGDVPAGDWPAQADFPDADYLEVGWGDRAYYMAAGLQRLLAHLRQSHELDGAGRPITLGPGLYGHSRFYASREEFHLFKTCNVWVATALHAAGVQVTPAMTLTTERLMAQLRPLAKVKP